jgi:LuxR family transcriptional regulator, maltose regulon positive regulatory protein
MHTSFMGRDAEEPIDRLPLLETKFFVPTWRPGLVSRPRLVERLDAAAAGKLTLVSAPAGFGKSTLLAEWLATRVAGRRPVAWVSLDETDNDPARFWAYLGRACKSVVPGLSTREEVVLPRSITSELTSLINELAAVDRDFTLLLDDLHAINQPSIHAALAFLVENQPPRMHLVVVSRIDPPLPLARLRARGEMAELRAADLRFTPDEAAAFLNSSMGLGLVAADVESLETRTEGWIAGLQLAALSLRGREDPSSFIRAFAGDDRYIVDYLVEEVLQRQPETVREFLLKTSILNRLSGPLCDAVTGRNDGAATLNALHRENLFVVPLDDKRHWYRYHQLFAGVLQVLAAEALSAQVANLRERAANWFEAQGMASEAIEQALAAAEPETVARLLVANIDEFERIGQFASIDRWSASLPVEMVSQRPRLALIVAASAIRTRPNLDYARQVIGWAESMIARIEAGGSEPADDTGGTAPGINGLEALKGELLALQITTARDWSQEELNRAIDQALALLPPERRGVTGLLQFNRGGFLKETEDHAAASATLSQRADEARRAGDFVLLSGILEKQAGDRVVLGQLHEGRRLLEESVLASQEFSSELAWGLSGPHARLAEIALEQDELATAVEHIGKFNSYASSGPKRSFVLHGRVIAAQVYLATGDLAAAVEQMAEARSFAHGVRVFRYASFLAYGTLTYFCQTGELQAAAAVAVERGLTPDAAIEVANVQEVIAYARFLIVRGETAGAVRLLDRIVAVTRAAGLVRDEIQALALLAQVLVLRGERDQAMTSLGRATVLGEPGGFNRTFTAAGPAMSLLLTTLVDALRRGRGPADAGSLLYLETLLGTAQRRAGEITRQSAVGALAEPLTGRELEILRLIEAGLRNSEIADRLFISVATVKRHISNCYGKLDARHRIEAIARARELGLL